MPSRAKGWVAIAVVVAVGLVMSFVVQERYHHRVLTLVFLWASMGLAWNIISGYAGQISFGHQAFFGIGAYVTVLLVVKTGLTPWLGMVVAVAAAVLAAVLIGLPTFRLAGIYFGLATLAYPLILRIVMDWLGYQEVAIPMKREHPHLTVLENVMVGAFAREAAVDLARVKAAAALHEVSLADRAELLPGGLTTLELRLMELARCLATAPRLVLLDEPLAGLSADGVEAMIAMIRRVRATGVTVVIIEHTMQALLKLADRLVVLDQGRRLAEGAPGQVTQDRAVIEAYLGKRWLARAGAPTC